MAFINETSRERIQKFYPHIPNKDFDEVMLSMTATEKYGSRTIGFTREDLIVITDALYEKADAINGCIDHDSKFTAMQIWNAVDKIISVFR